MQSISTVTFRPVALGQVVGKQQRSRPASGLQRSAITRHNRVASSSVFGAPQAAAGSSSSDAAAASSGSGSASATAALLQRMLASCSLGDRGTLVLAAVLTGGLVLGAAEPALAAHLPHEAGAAHPQLLGDLAENEDFWGNVLRYVSYFFSVLLGTVYIAVKPLIELLKRPGTAVLVVAGVGALVYFVSFTVQAMLGLNETVDYTASSIVTPLS